jgi:photosystem II stability/assembly factor-like uncharacterized protein
VTPCGTGPGRRAYLPLSVAETRNTVVLECAGWGEEADGFEPLSFWAHPLPLDRGRWLLESNNTGSAWGPGSRVVGQAPASGYGMAMVTSATGVLLGLGRQSPQRSTDFGRTWRTIPQLFTPGEDGDPSYIEFVDAEHGWCLFEGIGIWRTVDGGLVWHHGRQA